MGRGRGWGRGGQRGDAGEWIDGREQVDGSGEKGRVAAATIFWQFESERSNANVARGGSRSGRARRVWTRSASRSRIAAIRRGDWGRDRAREPRRDADAWVDPGASRSGRGDARGRLIGGRSVGGGRVASSGGRVPSLTLNILSLLVSPDPPAGASPSLDARTTAANRDGARARRPSPGLARHPCRPARGGREGWADSPRATPFADATVAALAAIAVAVVIVIAAEHAGPLFARVSRARAH
jgi:hypothetical protein